MMHGGDPNNIVGTVISLHLISDDLSYYLEVIDVADSTATAKVIGSIRPFYYIRVGDLVEIAK